MRITAPAGYSSRRAITGSMPAAPRAGHVRHHSVEDLAALLVRVESVLEVSAQEAAALRYAVSIGPLDEARLIG